MLRSVTIIPPVHLLSFASDRTLFQGPNPWKVIIVLEELSVPYEVDYLDMSTLKQEPYISVNPNGRVPAMEDPNTVIILWEVRWPYSTTSQPS